MNSLNGDTPSIGLTVGPLQYWWPRAAVLDFYAGIADSPAQTVVLGEVVCSRRNEFKAEDWIALARDLRRFIETAGEVGLKVIVRCGPWCHGEVRNGGVPDWAIAKGWKVRTDDPPYLDHIKVVYGQIAAQLKGQLWKEGGPVVGIQLENEYGGPAEHLLHLKEIARGVGLDVPLYTRTGWPELKTPMPFGEIAPLYGAYAEGFWDRETTPMPGHYWSVFHFSTLRTDANIANEALGRREVKDAGDVARYPYLTCEIGGGMMSSYHRRILVDPRDVEATVLVKIGSGSVSTRYSNSFRNSSEVILAMSAMRASSCGSSKSLLLSRTMYWRATRNFSDETSTARMAILPVLASSISDSGSGLKWSSSIVTTTPLPPSSRYFAA